MQYERAENPRTVQACFRELSKTVDRFSKITSHEIHNRPDLFFNLGGLLTCLLYTQDNQGYTWVEPFIDGINSFMDEISHKHTAQNPVIVAFRHPDVPQA